jgi:hypothetical protein
MTKLQKIDNELRQLKLRQEVLLSELPDAVLESNYTILDYDNTKALLTHHEKDRDGRPWSFCTLDRFHERNYELIYGLGCGYWFPYLPYYKLDQIKGCENQQFIFANFQLKGIIL